MYLDEYHNVISYAHNFDLSDKFQVVFEAHGSSLVHVSISFLDLKYT